MDIVFLPLIYHDDVYGLGWSAVFMVHFLIRTVNHINGYSMEMHEEVIDGLEDGRMIRRDCWALGKNEEVIFVGLLGLGKTYVGSYHNPAFLEVL